MPATKNIWSASLCWFPWGLPKSGVALKAYLIEYTGSDKPFYYYKDKTDYPDEKVPETPERHPDNHFTPLISYVYENGESVAKTLGQDGDRFDGINSTLSEQRFQL